MIEFVCGCVLSDSYFVAIYMYFEWLKVKECDWYGLSYVFYVYEHKHTPVFSHKLSQHMHY